MDARYGGYPLTQGPNDKTLLGYLHTHQLLAYLERKEQDVFFDKNIPAYFAKFMEPGKDEMKKGAIDLSRFVDETVVTVVKQTPAAQLQQIFRNLGVKIILVREKGNLVGVITKKAFILTMEELHHPHIVGHKRPEDAEAGRKT